MLSLGPYGADWKAGDIHDQVAREAQQKVQNLFGTCCKCGKRGRTGSSGWWANQRSRLYLSGRVKTMVTKEQNQTGREASFKARGRTKFEAEQDFTRAHDQQQADR